MLNLTCHCSRSGLVVRSSHLTPGEVRPGGLAAAVRGGRGQAALGAVCCPYHPQGPVGSMGPASHQAVFPTHLFLGFLRNIHSPLGLSLDTSVPGSSLPLHFCTALRDGEGFHLLMLIHYSDYDHQPLFCTNCVKEVIQLQSRF